MKKGLILFLAAAALSLGACKKKGCMDTSAVNYNAEAKKDISENSAMLKQQMK